MPVGYITIPRGEFEAILRQLREAADSARSGGTVHRRLGALGPLMHPPLMELARAIELCEEHARDISKIEAKLREFDQEMTPMRPSSSADITAAFKNASDFASGKKKPPAR